MPYFKLHSKPVNLSPAAQNARNVAGNYHEIKESCENVHKTVTALTKTQLIEELIQCGREDYGNGTLVEPKFESESDVYVKVKGRKITGIITKSLRFKTNIDSPFCNNNNNNNSGLLYTTVHGIKDFEKLLKKESSRTTKKKASISEHPINNEVKQTSSDEKGYTFLLINDDRIAEIDRAVMSLNVKSNNMSLAATNAENHYTDFLSKLFIAENMTQKHKIKPTIYKGIGHSITCTNKQLALKINKNDEIVEYKTWAGQKVVLDTPITLNDNQEPALNDNSDNQELALNDNQETPVFDSRGVDIKVGKSLFRLFKPHTFEHPGTANFDSANKIQNGFKL